MRRRIVVVPEASDLDSFGRLAAQIGHYFSHVSAERIVVFVDAGLLDDAQAWLDAPSLPLGFGDGVRSRLGAVRDAFDLRPWPSDLGTLPMASDLVLDWDVGRRNSEPWASLKAGYESGRTLFTVDWSATPSAAASMAEAARVISIGRKFDRSQAERFRELADRIGPHESAYLVGPGHSARAALDRDLSGGARVVDGSVVLDDELMAHVRPHVLTFVDPGSSVGPSASAQRFQRALVEQAGKHDFGVVTTERNAPLLGALVPEIAGRIIGVRVGPSGWPDNVDLRANLAVRAYPDLLTTLMLPIAATLSRSIRLIGFDGLDPGGDEGREHGATVERLLSQLEASGTKIVSLTESSIPALRRRPAVRADTGPPASSAPRAMLVSVTPDWSGDYGHFGPFERRVHETAERGGYAHVALTNAKLSPSAGWQHPTFSEPTFVSGRNFEPVGMHVQRELSAALEGLSLDPGSVVFFYSADVWHLAAILAVAPHHPQARFVVNLMRSHAWIASALEDPDPWAGDLARLLRSCLAAARGSNVSVTVDTVALSQDVGRLTGATPGVWPMIALARRPDVADRGAEPDRTIHLVSPVHASAARGYPELVRLSERLRPRLERGELRMTARWPVTGTTPGLLRMARQLEEAGVRLVRDNLGDDEFAALVASADIALIPYRLGHFRTRTSAVTIDALLAGKPVVTVKGTWSGDLVEHHGAGLTYTDGSVEEMEAAVSEVASRIEEFRRRFAEIAPVIATEHAPERLIEFLTAGSVATPASPPSEGDATDVAEMAELMRRRHHWHARAEDATRMAFVIRSDDQQRQIDTLKDEADLLRRAIAYRDRSKAARPAG